MSLDTPEPFLTMRDAVMEIRGDVKALSGKLDRIDREGSMGTKQELGDHETRIRGLERSGLRLAGAWTTLSIVGGLLAGVAGVTLGALAYFG